MAVATTSTFTVENHEGFLYGLSPMDTKLFSMLGSLFGGESVGSIVIPWQEYSLRDPDGSGRARTEGDDHPASTQVTRSPVHNVLQIVHESIDTSWTKRATSAMVKAIGANHPNVASVGLDNPVGDEHRWQQSQQTKEVVRDVEDALWNGSLVDPAVVGTARQTQGIIAATQTNHTDLATGAVSGATGQDADDYIDANPNGFTGGEKIQFTALTGGSNLVLNETYYVVDVDGGGAGTFGISTTSGGAKVSFGSDITSADYEVVADVTADNIEELMQLAWDNGGIMEGETATLWANSFNKRALSDVFIAAKNLETRTRSIGGVSVTTIITDFGDLNVVANRFMPKNTIQVISMEELNLAYLLLDSGEKIRVRDLQDSGGSRDRTILYFEFGLRYGNELKHAKLTGLSSR